MNRSPRLQTLGISLRVKLGVHTLRLTLYVHLEGFEALGLGPNLFNLGHSHSHHILSYISTRISMCSQACHPCYLEIGIHASVQTATASF